MDRFQLHSSFQAKGDQPQAIKKLVEGIKEGKKHQVLLGVTGSGKTYTIAKVIERVQLPALIISHNKTLAGQTYQELREFFPHSPVSYFVSYYDYYQPEAYLPASDTYISKEVEINPLLDQLRLQTTSNLFSFPRVIAIASVSCIYNLGEPKDYFQKAVVLESGQKTSCWSLFEKLAAIYYEKASADFLPATFRQRGERIDIFLAYEKEEILRIYFEGKRIKKLEKTDLLGEKKEELKKAVIFPAKHFLVTKNRMEKIFQEIRNELKEQLKKFKRQKKLVEAERLEKRVNYDLEMMEKTGYVNGIENYSRYFDGRLPNEPPFTLLDYFRYCYGKNFLVVIDESHVTIPQIKGMYRGDRERKKTLIDFGFRLPSCLDNRPLKFKEFLGKVPQVIYVSATPGDWEIRKAKREIVEQIIRPTGLVEPKIKVVKSKNPIAHLLKEIERKIKKGQRVLALTLTKKMAEDLASYFKDKEKTGIDIKTTYLHSEIETLKRTEILTQLRKGDFQVLIGVNLLREGLDLPEVGLVAILEAEKQGFLRSKTSLIQIMGRAARNLEGEVILYAESLSSSMKEAIKEVRRRRKIQLEYNRRHHIKPKSVKKEIRPKLIEIFAEKEEEPDYCQLVPQERKKYLKRLEKEMRFYARILDFEKAIEIRDKIRELEKIH